MPTIYTEVEVDVDLDNFDTEELLEELERRGNLSIEGSENAKAILEQIYYLRRQGQAYEHLMDGLIYAALGRVA